jgi:hypothetical protein
VGYYTLKYIVADLYGNVSDTAYRTVQVEINQTGPTVTLNGSDTVRLDVFTGYTEQGATAQSNTGLDLTTLIVQTGTVDTTQLGTYVISYSITDQFNFTSVAKRWVIVQDTIKPTINSQAGTATFNHQVGTPYLDPIVVSDNYWQNIQPTRAGVINPNVPGSYNLQYNAVDGSGNIAATFFATVVVKDLIPPTVTLIGANPLIVDVFTTFNDPGVNTSDNYYPNVTTVRTGVPTMTTLGSYTVTYTVTDGAGNTTVVTRQVNVVDRVAPEIQLLGRNPLPLPRYSTLVDPGVKLNDNYYSDAVLRTLLVANSSSVITDIPGYYFITYDVTDPSGNVAETVQRLIQVVESTTGIEDVNHNLNFSVYPNPTNGDLSVSSINGKTMKQIKVMDVLGNIVYNEMVNSNEVTIDITSGSAGVYLMFIEDEDGVVYRTKLVKE